VADLGLPLIVKAPLEGSSIGITKVTVRKSLQAAVDLARQYDKRVLAEQFIEGREFSVPVLGSGATARALPIVEIVAPGRQLRLPEQVLHGRHQVPLPGAAGCRHHRSDPARRREGLPRARLRRLEPHRRAAARVRQRSSSCWR
jgi:hypothetical protein